MSIYLQLPFNCDGCGDKFTRKKLLTDHFGICQAHLLKALQQRESKQPVKADGDTMPSLTLPQEQTVALLQEHSQLAESILQHQTSTALVLQHAAIIEQTHQPTTDLLHNQHHHHHSQLTQQQHLDATLQLQPIPLIEHHVHRQADETFHGAQVDQEQLILLQNPVDGPPGAEMDPSNIKVQVYSIL